MKAHHFLILVFCIVSFVSLSILEDEKIDFETSDTHDKKRLRTESGPVKARTCGICKSHVSDGSESKTHCDHFYHALCLHKEFFASDPKANVKCSQCGADVSYDLFIIRLTALPNPPTDIAFIPERISPETLVKLTFAAIRKNMLVVLRNMIKLKIPFNEHPIKQCSVLVAAASAGTLEAFKILMESGLKFAPEANNDVNTLFFNALYHKNLGVAKYLVGLGANVNRINATLKIGLIHDLVRTGNVEAVKCLIENKADVNLQSEKMGYPLHVAIENGHDEIVELLVKAGASTETTNRHSRTAFISACYLNKAGAVRILLEHGCKTQIYTVEGYNAMHFAMIPGSLDVVQYLMSRNFSIQRKEGTPSYVLHRVTYNGKTEMIKYLLNIGANPYEAFDSATYQLVLKDNPTFNDLLSRSDPAIVMAILSHEHEIVKAFLDAGVNPNTRIFFNSSSTLLHLAVQIGCTEVAQMLITRGADINAIDSDGFTPLSYATPEWAQVLTAHSAEAL